MPNIRAGAAKRSESKFFGVVNAVIWCYFVSMAIPTIKATYSLDPETVRLLERLAKRLETSKSEALRRAIRAAAASMGPQDNAAAALDRLQDSMNLTAAAAAGWARHARAERRAGSRHRGF